MTANTTDQVPKAARGRVVVEPGGAAALAAVTPSRYSPRSDDRVAVLLCGANTSAVDFAR